MSRTPFLRRSPCAASGRNRARAARGLLAGLPLVVACAGPEPEPGDATTPGAASLRTRLADAPTWVTRGCRSYWSTESERRRRLCGVGSASSPRDRVAARETAVARARSALARSLEVTIESIVRLEDGAGAGADGDLRAIVHQLSSASLPASEVVSVWSTGSGEVHALVALRVDAVQRSVHSTRSLAPARRDAIARRAEEAFAELDRADDGAR